MSTDYVLKIILIGDCGVGKTRFLSKITDRRHNPQVYIPTIGVDFGVINYITKCNRNVKCHIWDTAGQEQFESITRSYYNGSSGVILIFDASSVKSFNNIQKWEQLIQDECQSETVIILVANKIDKDRKVSYETAYTYAINHNMVYVEMSLKTDYGIDKVIPTIVEQIMSRIVNVGIIHSGIVDKTKLNKLELNKSISNTNCCIFF